MRMKQRLPRICFIVAFYFILSYFILFYFILFLNFLEKKYPGICYIILMIHTLMICIYVSHQVKSWWVVGFVIMIE